MAERSPGRQVLDLAELAGAGTVLPWDPSTHAARCDLCGAGADVLSDLEARYLAWTPLGELVAWLAGELESVSPARCRSLVREHAAAYLWDLRRCAELSTAYSRIVEAGLDRLAGGGEVSTAELLSALRDLHSSRTKTTRTAGGAGRTIEPGPPGAVPLDITYEERTRRVRAGLWPPADPPPPPPASHGGLDRSITPMAGSPPLTSRDSGMVPSSGDSVVAPGSRDSGMGPSGMGSCGVCGGGFEGGVCGICGDDPDRPGQVSGPLVDWSSGGVKWGEL